MKDIRDYSLLGHNTFGIEAHCRRFLEFETEAEAQQVVWEMLSVEDEPLLFLGAGSNLVLTHDYAGTVVHSAIRGIRVVKEEGDVIILECGSGETFDDVVAYCVEHGYHGAENLSLIPGEVGASAVQNIGAYGVEAKDIISQIKAVDRMTGEFVWIDKEDCAYAYRNSKFKTVWKDRYVIAGVRYQLTRSFTPHLDYGNIRSSLSEKGIEYPTAAQLRETIIAIRNAKLPDPKVLGNAGSFFMNPIVDKEKYEDLLAQYPTMPHYLVDDSHVKIPAGWMIDQCGWKGKNMGNVGVYEKQALVLINLGGATGTEVVNLCEAIQYDVMQKFGIMIHPEANII